MRLSKNLIAFVTVFGFMSSVFFKKKLLGPQLLIPVKPAFLKCLLLVNTFPFEYGKIRNRCDRLLTNVLIIQFYILASLRVSSVSRPLSY